MKYVAWLFQWTLKAAIFFTLFAFALNNQGNVTVHFFFGQQWTGPMVLVVLSAFAAGLLVGVLGMVPRWWRQRRATQQAQERATTITAHTVPPATETTGTLPPHGI